VSNMLPSIVECRTAAWPAGVAPNPRPRRSRLSGRPLLSRETDLQAGLLRSQRDDGIDPCCAPGREVTGDGGHRSEHHEHTRERNRIRRCDAVEPGAQPLREGQAQDQSAGSPTTAIRLV
jgi:hypothetical protein